MNQMIRQSAIQSLPWNIDISPISLFPDLMADTSMWRPRESGTTRIDINISLSSNNTQSTTSVSYSSEQSSGLEKEARQLTETYVKAMEEVFSKASLGSIPTTEQSHESGSTEEDKEQ